MSPGLVLQRCCAYACAGQKRSSRACGGHLMHKQRSRRGVKTERMHLYNARAYTAPVMAEIHTGCVGLGSAACYGVRLFSLLNRFFGVPYVQVFGSNPLHVELLSDCRPRQTRAHPLKDFDSTLGYPGEGPNFDGQGWGRCRVRTVLSEPEWTCWCGQTRHPDQFVYVHSDGAKACTPGHQSGALRLAAGKGTTTNATSTPPAAQQLPQPQQLQQLQQQERRSDSRAEAPAAPPATKAGSSAASGSSEPAPAQQQHEQQQRQQQRRTRRSGKQPASADNLADSMSAENATNAADAAAATAAAAAAATASVVVIVVVACGMLPPAIGSCCGC